jgi:hypothetical protein
MVEKKPYIVVTTWAPLSLGKKVIETYAEVRKKFPVDKSLTKELVQGILKVEGGKSKSITISKVKEDMMNKALIRQQNAMVPFHEIEGFEYTIDVYFDFPETFSMLGMQAPD